MTSSLTNYISKHILLFTTCINDKYGLLTNRTNYNEKKKKQLTTTTKYQIEDDSILMLNNRDRHIQRQVLDTTSISSSEGINLDSYITDSWSWAQTEIMVANGPIFLYWIHYLYLFLPLIHPVSLSIHIIVVQCSLFTLWIPFIKLTQRVTTAYKIMNLGIEEITNYLKSIGFIQYKSDKCLLGKYTKKDAIAKYENAKGRFKHFDTRYHFTKSLFGINIKKYNDIIFDDLNRL
ncbi:hypothetical protein H8356DRAFT_1362268 [Neocallimastix lanati (nom. inval.)]|nr:hypothetical protein H8356DRAFT_1362268 [Neocallimastix sp. JGI-2020a]